jgi:TPR repeat protein
VTDDEAPIPSAMLALTLAFAVSAAPSCRLGDAASCTRMCDGGEMHACVVLGSMYAEAVGVDRDSKRATTLFLKACNKGDGDGCNAEGVRVRERLLDGHDDAGWDVVAKWFDKACSQGSAKGCNNIADALVDGHVAGKSASDAVPLWRKGCELETEGSASSCLAYGQALARGTGTQRDDVLAGKWLARACRLGAHEACAMAEDLGEHVVVTAESRARLLQAKCDAGDPKACGRVGFELLEKNPAAAKAPLGAACTADDARACSALGMVLLRDGAGSDAVARLSHACDLDDAHSCRVLADEVLVGHVVARDEARAITLYKKGCALGEQSACKHESGIAMARTLKRNGDGLVETVLKKPCKDGDADSCFALKGLGKPAKVEVVDQSRAVAAVDETERACNAGDGRACFTAGKRASGVKAVELFDLGCRAGYPKACAESGAKFIAAKDTVNAVDAFARGCSLGSAESCKAVVKLGDTERVQPLLAQACSAKVDGACDAVDTRSR